MDYTEVNVGQDRGGGWDELQGRLSESHLAAPSPVPALAMSAAPQGGRGRG
jgi:hypothetical protein